LAKGEMMVPLVKMVKMVSLELTEKRVVPEKTESST